MSAEFLYTYTTDALTFTVSQSTYISTVLEGKTYQLSFMAPSITATVHSGVTVDTLSLATQITTAPSTSAVNSTTLIESTTSANVTTTFASEHNATAENTTSHNSTSTSKAGANALHASAGMGLTLLSLAFLL